MARKEGRKERRKSTTIILNPFIQSISTIMINITTNAPKHQRRITIVTLKLRQSYVKVTLKLRYSYVKVTSKLRYSYVKVTLKLRQSYVKVTLKLR